MTKDALRARLAELELGQRQAARLLGIDERTKRGWAVGEAPIPGPVVPLLAVLDIPEVRQRLEDTTGIRT